MNFLLHHSFAAAELGSRAAAVGAMLPDLWRMADRRVRATTGARGESPAAQEAALGDVLAGIEHHLEIDRWFHRTEVFLDGERRTAERLRAAAGSVPRLGLFAHVTWEMCLDGALVRRRGLDAQLEDLRAGLRDASGDARARAAELHHFDRVARAEHEREAFESRLRRLWEAVAKGPWIEGYRHGAGLAERLGGIRSRFGFAPLGAHDAAAIAGALDELAEAASPALEALLQARRDQVAAA